ncbi:MAG: Uncharacterized protein G01um101448_206 [Parcubacteria group bacterium Gr01-1014_48]|nr:MAG: Uncharacterized protein Greene041614_958 [Parcubacteria group bacterium Greene0416_14]TSC74330.1 MAG: Uncharacterized protein G01um101448_206 [Parcubacteria group bacterium Gr01-1014_48]TSD01030.1 MAG: Uncharacterized protein Greene101415_531 [Parcubacteria group bacterium Greene1014_15]TSD07722.1 MAG: Uncharacterized protein Greene07144_785 [Parcubacteria group bacterium Greene0714_4]
MYFFTQIAFSATVDLLAPLPGTGDSADFNKYVPLAFNIAIGIAGVLAVIMLIIGGLQYMSTDAISGKSEAKSRITAALGGLLLALAAFIILQQINPNLVNFNLPNLVVGITRSAAPAQTPTQRPGTPAGTPDTRISETACRAPCENLTGVRVSPKACKPPRASCGVMLNDEVAVGVGEMDQILRNQGLTMQVTEGYPPTIDHKNDCHKNGTCIDYNFVAHSGVATAAEVNKVVAAAQTSEMVAIYEVGNNQDRQALMAAGVPASNVACIPGINSPHFSVYRPGLSAGGGAACTPR